MLRIGQAFTQTAEPSSNNDFAKRRPWLVVSYSTMTGLLFFVPAAVIAHTRYVWLWFPLWIVQAIALVGFSNAAHECTHGLYVRGRLLNRIAGTLWMLPLLLNFGLHRRYHLKHHSFTSQPEDPEFTFEYARFESIIDYSRAAARWLAIPTPLHRLNWSEAFRVSFGRGSIFVTNSHDRFHTVCNMLMVLVWLLGALLATFHWTWLIPAYWVPLIFFFPLVAWFTALPEHYGTESGDDAFLNTRSVYTSNLRRPFWNFNYHTAHHFAPSVPFYNLPSLDEKIRTRIRYQTSSYFAFHFGLLKNLSNARRSK